MKRRTVLTGLGARVPVDTIVMDHLERIPTEN
jgi:hypothetical protein